MNRRRYKEPAPERYQVLEYLESTGTQYINLDFSANGYLHAKYTFLIPNIYVKFCFIIGAHNSGRPYGRAYGSYNVLSLRWELGTGETYLTNKTYGFKYDNYFLI